DTFCTACAGRRASHRAIYRFSRTLDTAGEFPPAVDWPESGQDETRGEGKSAVLDAPAEFASSITLDGHGVTTSRNDRESRQNGDFCVSWPSLIIKRAGDLR